MKNYLFISLILFLSCAEPAREIKLSQNELEKSISSDQNFQVALTGMTTVNNRLAKSIGRLSHSEVQDIKNTLADITINENEAKSKLENIAVQLGFKGFNDYQNFCATNIRKPLSLTIERFKKDQISDDNMKTALANVILSLNPSEHFAGRTKVGCVDYDGCINNSWATYSYILYGCFNGQTGGLGVDHCIQSADISLMTMEFNCAIGCLL